MEVNGISSLIGCWYGPKNKPACTIGISFVMIAAVAFSAYHPSSP
jgi:hypothetical protein